MSIHQSSIQNVSFGDVSTGGSGIYDIDLTYFTGTDSFRNYSSVVIPLLNNNPPAANYSGILSCNVPATVAPPGTVQTIQLNPVYDFSTNSWFPGYGQSLSVYGSVLLGTVAGLPDALLTDGNGHLQVNVTAINDPVTVQEIVDPVTVQEIVTPVTVQEIVDPVTVHGSVAALGNGATSNDPFTIALNEDFPADFPNAKPAITFPIGYQESGGYGAFNFNDSGGLSVSTLNGHSNFSQVIVEVKDSNNLLLAGGDLGRVFINIRNNDAVGKITLCFDNTAAFGEGIVINAGESYEFNLIPTNDIYAIGDIVSNPNVVIITAP